MSKEKQYWLMKSEADEYGIHDLQRDRTTLWTGVRNYQARNFMTQEMKEGDGVLFYHSNSQPSGVAGMAEISGSSQPDPLQFDEKSDYFESRATAEKPVWFAVQITYVATFPKVLPLAAIRDNKKLKSMQLLRPGQRLSVQPVSAAEFEEIQRMAKAYADAT